MRELANELNRTGFILNDYREDAFQVRVTTYLANDRTIFVVVMQHGEVISITQAL